jgi:hypothetical protein
MLATQTPLAEVLAVIGKQPITILTYPGARALDYLLAFEARRRMRFDPHRPAARESSQRDFFDWPPMQATCESCVVHHVAVAHIDSVVQIASARCNKVSPQGEGKSRNHGEHPLIKF